MVGDGVSFEMELGNHGFGVNKESLRFGPVAFWWSRGSLRRKFIYQNQSLDAARIELKNIKTYLEQVLKDNELR